MYQTAIRRIQATLMLRGLIWLRGARAPRAMDEADTQWMRLSLFGSSRFRSKLSSLLGLMLSLAAFAGAHAQSYPVKPVTVIVPFPAGSTSDVIVRLLAPRMPELLGQPLIVENRPGAAGSIGTAAVARAPADGYTLLFTSPAHTANTSLYSNLPWDPVKSFAPVIMVGAIPNVVAVMNSSPFKTLTEFIDYARANPGKLNYASSGVGTSPHLMTEMLKQAARIDLINIPYKGSPEALNALMTGDVAMAPLGVLIAKSRIDSGELRALAVSSFKRSSVLPNVPTVAESGFPEYDVRPWQGIFAPAGTPPVVVAKLNSVFGAALKLAEVEGKLLKLGVELDAGSPDDMAKFIQTDVARWAKVVKQGNIRLE